MKFECLAILRMGTAIEKSNNVLFYVLFYFTEFAFIAECFPWIMFGKIAVYHLLYEIVNYLYYTSSLN